MGVRAVCPEAGADNQTRESAGAFSGVFSSFEARHPGKSGAVLRQQAPPARRPLLKASKWEERGR